MGETAKIVYLFLSKIAGCTKDYTAEESVKAPMRLGTLTDDDCVIFELVVGRLH